MRELVVALTFDVDNDFTGRPADESRLAWRGLDEGAALAFDGLDRVARQLGQPVPTTWFVRVDRQVALECGSLTWCAGRFRTAYGEAMAAGGHELQWHAHLYRRGAAGWELETDPAGQREQLTEAHQAQRDAGFTMTVSRIGEAQFTNQIGQILRDLGVRADSTAMPGRAIPGRFDWLGAPDLPYRQAAHDYRRPAERTAQQESLLQIPFTMLDTLAPYDERPLRRYANLGFAHSVIGEPLRAAATVAPLIVTMAHPFEFLPEASHALWGGTFDNYLTNLVALVEAARHSGRRVRFVTMSQLVTACEQGELLQDSLGTPAVDQMLSAG